MVRLVVARKGEAGIAAELGLSQHTIHSYMKRLYTKLSVCDRVELVVKVFSTHLYLLKRDTSE